MPSSASRACTSPEHLGEVEVSLRRTLLDHLVDLGVAARVQRREREILELHLHVLHAEAMGQRGVDVEGFAGRALLLERGQRGDGAEIVEAVGELDDQHPHVGCDRHDHLAHRGRLLLLLGVVLDPFELGDTVDDARQVGTELSSRAASGRPGCLRLHRAAGQPAMVVSSIPCRATMVATATG